MSTQILPQKSSEPMQANSKLSVSPFRNSWKDFTNKVMSQTQEKAK